MTVFFYFKSVNSTINIILLIEVEKNKKKSTVTLTHYALTI